MKKCTLLLLSGLLFSLSCAEQETDFEFEETANLPSFTAIGEDLETVWQLDFDGVSETVQTQDIGQQLDINANYLTLRQNGNQLSFYSFDSGFFDLSQKNVETGEIAIYDRFYLNTDERSVVWGINSETDVFFGFFAPLGSTNLALRKIEIGDFEGQDFSLEANITRLYPPLYENGKLFIPYQDGVGTFKVSAYDTLLEQVVLTLNFGDARPSIFTDSDGNLAVLKFQDATGVILDIYDFESLQLLQSTPLNLNQIFSIGAIEAELRGDELVYEYTYVQPAALATGPAVFNIGAQQNSVLALGQVIDSIETNSTKDLAITTQRYSFDDAAFYVGYLNLAAESTIEGGVFVLSNDGELLKNIEVDFVPTYILKD